MTKRDELIRDENTGRMGVMGALGALATFAVSAGIAVMRNTNKTQAAQMRDENVGMENLSTLAAAILSAAIQNTNKSK